jgi:biopolymer transport protein ExbD
MRGACFNSWQTDACQWSIGYVWRSSDWVERAVFIAFALMFAYIVFVFGRFSRRYYLARRESRVLVSNSCREFQRSQKNLVADLSRGLRVLKAISSAAPFLGLAGTSYGILATLFRGFAASRSSVLAYLSTSIPAPLISAAAGIFVAIPAIVSHNIQRRRIEVLLTESSFSIGDCAKDECGGMGSFQRAQTLPLKKRFSSLPPFALLAAPALGCIVALFMLFHPYRIPTGLRVALPSTRYDDGQGRLARPDRFIVLRITTPGELFINMEPLRWAELSSRVAAIYRPLMNRELYLYAEDGVPFQTVADAIDVVRNSPGPDSLDIKVVLVTPKADREYGFIPIRTMPIKHDFR